MIREDRVIEETALARIDSTESRALQQKADYFKTDYIIRETLKSFVTGTLCYLIMLAIWVLWNLSTLINHINTLDYVSLGMKIVGWYVFFIVVYIGITYAVYYVRYLKSSAVTEQYTVHLHKLGRIYSREENLKL